MTSGMSDGRRSGIEKTGEVHVHKDVRIGMVMVGDRVVEVKENK